MEHLLNNSIERIRNAAHTRNLLHKADVSVCLKCEEFIQVIFIHNGEIQLKTQSNESEDLLIEGNKDSMKILLNGENFLTSMKKREDIVVSGKLKDILLMESIWYLTQKNKN